MSSLPGLTLEAFVAWQWNLVVQDQPENNFSLGMAEYLGVQTHRTTLTKEQFAQIIVLYEPYRLSNFVYVDGEVQGYIKGLIPQSHDHAVPPYYLEKSVSLVDLIPYKI